MASPQNVFVRKSGYAAAAVACPLFLSLLLPVSAQAAGVAGTLTVAGKPQKVSFACAYEEEDPFEKGQIRMVVLLASPAEDIRGVACRVAQNMLRDKSAAETGGGEGALPYLAAHVSGTGVDPAKSVWTSGYLVAKGQYYSYSFSGTSVSTRAELKAGAAGGDTIDGRLYTEKEISIGSSFPEMAVDVLLNGIPLDKLAPKSEELTGDAARKHPAMQAAMRFLGALENADAAAMRAMMVEKERPLFDKLLASPDKDKFLEMSKAMASDARKANTFTVTARGAVHQISLANKSGDGSTGTMSFYFVQEKGEWRITQQR